MTLEISPLSEKDKAEWLLLWKGYQLFYDVSIDNAITEQTWHKLMHHDNMFGMGVFKNGKLVGIANLVTHPHTWMVNDCCYLIDLFVDITERGQGLGRTLIEGIYDHAKANNYQRVYWLTKEDNYQARILYDKLAKKADFIQYRCEM